jgi:transposase-like protein
MAKKAKPNCPNCSSFKLKSGKDLFRGGIVFTILAIPWCVILIGIPFLIAGIVVTSNGKRLGKNGYKCDNCKWEGEIDTRTG